MTNPFTAATVNDDYLDMRGRQNQLMIVRIWDQPRGVRTKNNKDGWVYPKTGDPFPNTVIRAAIVDVMADNGVGKLYPETWIQAASLMRVMRKWVGQTKLITWHQNSEPADSWGNPDKSNPYNITDMSGVQEAVDAALAWIAANPIWNTLVPPAPMADLAPTDFPPAHQRQAPPQQQWQPMPPQGQWNQQPPMPPQQPVASWNTAAPPPEYYQQQQYGQQPQYQNQAPPQQSQQGQWGQQPQQAPPQQWGQQPPAPQQPQGQPGSFLQASQGIPTPQHPQQQPQWNQGAAHHGFEDKIPF